jgi:alpha-L-fucosidase
MATHPVRDPLVDRVLPAWFDDAKLGIFIHWTAASIPAFAPLPAGGVWPLPEQHDDPRAWSETPYAEAYQDSMAFADNSTARYHAEHYPGLTYDDFVHQWRDLLDRWDPEPWADLFERAGAGYVVLTTKIEDGFLLWPSSHPNPHLPDWQSRRDVVGELNDALRRRGIRFGVYYSGLDVTFSPVKPPTTSLEDMAASYPRTREYARYVTAHWMELIDRYEPAELWCDFGYPDEAEVTANDLFRHYLERVPDGVINDRFDEWGDGERTGAAHSDFRTFEYKRDFSKSVLTRKWEATRGMGFSFGYNRQETDRDYSRSAQLIHELIDIVARGGNFLLNVGPTASGEVPWLQAQRLVDIGWWLRRYGSAIYGTRTWDRPTGSTADGMPVRFTMSDDAVHAIVLGAPSEAAIELDVRLDPSAEVFLEDQPGALAWRPTGHGVRIVLPEQPDEGPAIALRLAPVGAVRSGPAGDGAAAFG